LKALFLALLLLSPRLVFAADVAAPPEIEVTNVEYRIVEKNNVWWRFSWKLYVWNRGSEPARFTAVINFLEQQGFIVDRSFTSSLFIAAGNNASFDGSTLINVSIAPKVARATGEVRPIR
jgi:hypothetical protein